MDQIEMGKTYYEVLEVPETAGDQEIRSAYYQLMKRWHPDSNLECAEEAHHRSIEINQAWAVLRAAKTRRAYDQEIFATRELELQARKEVEEQARLQALLEDKKREEQRRLEQRRSTEQARKQRQLETQARQEQDSRAKAERLAMDRKQREEQAEKQRHERQLLQREKEQASKQARSVNSEQRERDRERQAARKQQAREYAQAEREYALRHVKKVATPKNLAGAFGVSFVLAGAIFACQKIQSGEFRLMAESKPVQKPLKLIENKVSAPELVADLSPDVHKQPTVPARIVESKPRDLPPPAPKVRPLPKAVSMTMPAPAKPPKAVVKRDPLKIEHKKVAEPHQAAPQALIIKRPTPKPDPVEIKPKKEPVKTVITQAKKVVASAAAPSPKTKPLLALKPTPKPETIPAARQIWTVVYQRTSSMSAAEQASDMLRDKGFGGATIVTSAMYRNVGGGFVVVAGMCSSQDQAFSMLGRLRGQQLSGSIKIFGEK